MEERMEDLLQVGVIASTHGIRGEVKVFPTTDDVNRFKKLKEVLLDTGKETITLEIESVKFFKKMVILKFKQFNNINEIEKYKSRPLLVTRSNAVKLQKGEYFITDLRGLSVVGEHDEEIGTLKDVMETGANDVYVIEMTDGKELLLPAIKQCVLEINMENKFIKVHIMDGLLD